jgi:hypothetical protein
MDVMRIAFLLARNEETGHLVFPVKWLGNSVTFALSDFKVAV